MTIASLSDVDLHSSTLLTSKKEKAATLDLLNHLIEINRRKLFVEYGCSSLNKYVVTQLKYSPAGHLCGHPGHGDIQNILFIRPGLESQRCG